MSTFLPLCTVRHMPPCIGGIQEEPKKGTVSWKFITLGCGDRMKILYF